LKRSNRLVLLVGVFLAIVAFVGILLLVRNPQTTPQTEVKTTGPVVVATADIPLSTRIRADQVTVSVVPLTAIPPDAFVDPSQVIGKVARQQVTAGGQITASTLNAGNGVNQIATPIGMRSMAVQVDQVSGVGTVIQTGDYVDMIVGLTGDKFPVITISPVDNSITVVSGLNSTSVKLLIQGMQVLGTLLPPQETTAAPAPVPSAGTGTGTPQSNTTLNGQQEIVILAVTPQQAEVIKFAQLDSSISLILRSPDDFIDPATGAPLPPVSAKTTGVILKSLVDSFGVLPPEVVQTVTPTATKKP
jgi:pilus assembly protein CpaB